MILLVNRGKKKITKLLSCCFPWYLLETGVVITFTCTILWLGTVDPGCKLYIVVTSPRKSSNCCYWVWNWTCEFQTGRSLLHFNEATVDTFTIVEISQTGNSSGLQWMPFKYRGNCNDHKQSRPCLAFNLQFE